jgi:hypothetical protein
MKAIAAAAVLAALAAPALAQDQSGNVERVETPQGTVTIVRPTPRAQPATPAPYVNPDPVPPPPVTPFPTDQDRSSQYNGAPYAGTTAPYAPYPYVYGYPPPVVIIQRRGVDTTRPVRPPGAPMQSRDGFGRPLPPPRFPGNQFGPGAVPGAVPLPDASQVIIVPR